MRFPIPAARLAFAGVALALTGGIAAAQTCPGDDALEDNDTCQTSLSTLPGSYSNLAAVRDDSDYFTVSLANGDILTADALFTHANGDIDMSLQSVAGCGFVTLATSVSVTDNETIVWTNNTGQTLDYIVRVYLFTGSTTDCNDYTLNINVMQDPCLTLPDDGLEQNDTCPSAVVIGAGSTTGLVVFNGDDDYYRITCPADNYINVDAIFTHVPTSGDIDIELYDDVSCTSLVDSGLSGTNDESVSVNNQTGVAADYILRVLGNGAGFSCNQYDLNVTFVPDPCANPVDDSFEQNDDCPSAAVLGAGSTTGLITFQGDDDYYRITVPAGNILTVDALFTHVSGTGDIDMQLFDDAVTCGNQVDGSASVTNDEQVSWNNTTGAAADFVVRVFGYGTSFTCNNYDLNVTFTPDPCASLADDGFEPNDDCSVPAAVSNGLTSNLAVFKTSEDWYSINVPDGATINVDALFTHASADLDMAIYDSCGGSALDTSVSVDDNEFVTFTNTSGSAVTALINVYVYTFSSGDCNTYDLNVDVAGGGFYTSFCEGDSLGICPCGNESVSGSGEGCVNSTGVGAILTALGSNVVTNDDLVLHIDQGRPGKNAVFLQGGSTISSTFRDGVLCMGNPTVRLEFTTLDSAGSIDSTISIVTKGGATASQTLYYQGWFRDGMGPCGTGSNLSNGIQLTWQ